MKLNDEIHISEAVTGNKSICGTSWPGCLWSAHQLSSSRPITSDVFVDLLYRTNVKEFSINLY